MLQSTPQENLQQASERQANFILLRSLEGKLSQTLFEKVVDEVKTQFDFPKRIDWQGNTRELSFEELKVNYAQVDQNFLAKLVESTVSSNNKAKQCQQNYLVNFQKNEEKMSSHPLCKPKNLTFRYQQLDSMRCMNDSHKLLALHEISKFERMKTVFGHALIEEGYNAPIYNVKYDQTGQFIISGADDGIIKIWDKNTLNLQASLHSHVDVITDMDISKCNNLLVTASKDGKIIVWDWRQCIKIDEINDHRSTINNIKFFSLRSQRDSSSEDISVLVSCSEDGTIKIYDEISYLNSLKNQNENVPQPGRRSNRTRSDPAQPKLQRFQVTLMPEDFRPGAKNKKIDSVHVTRDGLVAAGSDKGEIFLWRLDVNALKKHSANKISQYFGSFKKHTKTVHFCEFSPNGKQLFTGSIDGTAKIWNVDFKGAQPDLTDEKLLATLEERRVPTKEERLTYFTDNLGNVVNLGQHKEKKSTWQCDSLTWSVHGRYAIAALSGKYEEQNNQENSLIKVWDSFTNEIIQDLTKGNIQLQNFTFVLSPHPKIEEILMSGSDGGTICLWNIKTRQLIKHFLEYGVYSFEKYTMNDPYDGRFSPDGSNFVVGSVMGTISLFANDDSQFKYSATRVEQFYPNDDTKHSYNIYYGEQAMEEPQVCGYSLIPYELQPPSSQLGKFKGARQQTHEEYERDFLIRQELSRQEEVFIQNQLEEGLDNAMYNYPNIPQRIEFVEENKLEDDIIPIRRSQNRALNSQNAFSVSDSPIPRENLEGASQEEDARMLNQIHRAEGRRINNSRRGGINNRVNRIIMNPNIDPDNSLYDRDSDENFDIPEEDSSKFEEEESDSEEESETSESGVRLRSRGVRSNNRANSRNARQMRRQNIRDNMDEGVRTRNRMGNARIEENSSDDEDDEDAYGMSDVNEGPVTRRRLQRNNGSKGKNVRLPSSDDESIDSVMLDEDETEEFGRTRSKSKRNASRSKGKTTKKGIEQGRNLRSRGNRVNYKEIDNSSEPFIPSEDEEIKRRTSSSRKSEEDQIKGHGSRNKRQIIDDSEDQEMHEQELEIHEEYSKKLKGDEDFELINNDNQLEENKVHDESCAFCGRPDGPRLGPFIRVKPKRDQSKFYYFHNECLEANNISFFCKQKNKYLNIGKALDRNRDRPTMCDRCGKVGATIKCMTCRHTYHGYLCSTLYMIYMGTQEYQCFECRNKDNFGKYRESCPIEKAELKLLKKSIQREYLLVDAPQQKVYLPQIGDQVYYFYEGHEKFIQSNNCFFYCGDSKELPFQYPWIQYQALREPQICTITAINYRFPSNNALYLLKRFGKTIDPPQIPQIISKLTLEFNEDFFDVDIFPSALPNFLVLKSEYEQSQREYIKLQRNGQLIGKTFHRKKDGVQFTIESIHEYDDNDIERTNWQTLNCKLHENGGRERMRRGGRRGDPEEAVFETLNFWELDFNQAAQEQPVPEQALNEHQKQAAINVILDVVEKKKDISEPFLARVPEAVAKDYRYIIAAEMYINLIQMRLNNSYYRSIEQLYADIDQISLNSRIYNGEDHQLTADAKKLVETIKRQMRSQLSSNAILAQDIPIKQPEMESTKVIINIGKLQFPNGCRPNAQPGRVNVLEQDRDVEERNLKLDINNRKSVKREYVEEEKVAFTCFEQANFGKSGTDVIMPIAVDMSNGRRSTRQNARLQQQNEPQATKLFNVQVARKPDNNGKSEEILGKTTRSGRLIKTSKLNLKEESDRESEEFSPNEEEGNVGSRKRLRKF